MSVSAGNQLPAALKPFALRQYRLLVLGLMLAMFADGVWTVGVVWQVIELGGGPGQLAVVTGVAAVGMVVSTLAGGILADRVSQRRIMIGLELVKLAAFGIVDDRPIGRVTNFKSSKRENFFSLLRRLID